MEKVKKEGQGDFDITVKISGNALKRILAVRGKREKRTGRTTSIVELVREAIDCWYDVEVEVI